VFAVYFDSVSETHEQWWRCRLNVAVGTTQNRPSSVGPSRIDITMVNDRSKGGGDGCGGISSRLDGLSELVKLY
jgi:hypothetical protein